MNEHDLTCDTVVTVCITMLYDDIVEYRLM